MKRLSLFVLAAVICIISSCTGPQGLPGRDGRDGKDGRDADWATIIIKVPQEYWQYTQINNNNCYYATVDVPEITKSVCSGGLVKMYRVYGDIQGTFSQEELPYVRPLEEYIEEEDAWAFYTETVTYEFSPGQMTIFYTLSDFLYEVDPYVVPEEMCFRCVVMY